MAPASAFHPTPTTTKWRGRNQHSTISSGYSSDLTTFSGNFHSVRYRRLTKADSLVTQVNDFIMILSFHQARSSSQKWPNEVKISFLRAQTKNDKQKATVNETKMATWTRTNVNWLRNRLRPQRSFHQKLLLLPPVGHIKTATATTFSVGQQTSSRADAVC